MGADENRLAPRIPINLWVQITGVDPEPKLRTGDLSLGGLFLELPHEVGAVGSVQRITLASGDVTRAVTVLARIVRTATVDDLWRSSTLRGVAFQFVSEERGGEVVPAQDSEAIRGLLRHAVKSGAEQGHLSLDHTFQGALAGASISGACVSGVNLHGMWLETDQPIAVGEPIRVDIPVEEDHGPLIFEGTVVESEGELEEGAAPRFRTRVRFEARPRPSTVPVETRPLAAESLGDAVSVLLDAVTSTSPHAPANSNVAHGFAGELSRISLPTVLTLCQLERVTGVLHLREGDTQLSAYVREGELIDVDDGRDGEPRQLLADVLRWTQGMFELNFAPVEREDRIGMSTTGLLIDLARESDEASGAF